MDGVVLGWRQSHSKRAMRRKIGLLVLISAMLAISINVFAQEEKYLQEEEHLIIGGERIGPAKLWMTREEIKKENENSPCPVEAVYFNNRATELMTSWGGVCATPEGIMASTSNASFVVSRLGLPDETKTESATKDLRTDLWYYYERGIGFRVIYAEDGNLVNFIIVFSKRNASL